MRISEQKIEEIRNAADVVDIISGYVQLRKLGRNFKGLCPFHQEKTPSFTVSEEKQIFHCFGCGAGGNVFKFLMDFKNISFVEAVEEVADHLGIKIQHDESHVNQQQNELEELYEINNTAERFFSDNLLKNSTYEEAREYFKNRNVKIQTQKHFKAGFAPYGWDNFLSHAKENNIDLKKAKILGLIDQNDKGEYYDKFRGRVIFPIFSPNGRVIAFGGRILEKQENAAKYLNSPESPIYSKRKSLYGLFHSKDEIRRLDRAILVEGYMDLISLFQAGVKNVVASSGTSLTDEQVQLLSRFTKNIIILFDADPAGQKASLRSIEILLKQDFEVKVMSLPKGEDPDSYINNYGKERFDELVSSAKNFLEYQTAQFEEQGLFEDPANATDAVRELVKNLALVSDEIKRSFLIKSIAKKFSLRERLIETELNLFIEKVKIKVGNKEFKNDTKIVDVEKEQLNFRITESQNPYEKEIIRLLYLGKGELIEYILEKVGLNQFSNQLYKKLVEVVIVGYDRHNISPAYLIDQLENPNLKRFIIQLAIEDYVISSTWNELALDGKIELDNLQYARDTVAKFLGFPKIQEKNKNIRIIAESKDERLHIELLKRNNELNEEIMLLNI